MQASLTTQYLSDAGARAEDSTSVRSTRSWVFLTLLLVPLLCFPLVADAQAQASRAEATANTAAKKTTARKAATKASTKSTAKKRDAKIIAKTKRPLADKRNVRGKTIISAKRANAKATGAAAKRTSAAGKRTSRNGESASLRGPKPLPPLASKLVISTPAAIAPTSTPSPAMPAVAVIPSPAPALPTVAAPATVGASTLVAWIGIPILASLAAVLLQRRRRVSAEKAPAPQPIDPVLHLEPSEVALTSAQVREDLLQRAEPFYIDLRAASGRKDHDYILQHCTEDMATSLILDSEVAKSNGEPKVEALKAELVDLFEEVNRYVASVQFTADEHHGEPRPRKVKELWHFIREPEAPAWRLAAVEPA